MTMHKIHKEALAEDDASPDDDVLDATGCNKHGCRPCPFCGATDVHSGPVVVISGGHPDHAVNCGHCDCRGPWAVSPKIATVLWNEGFDNARPASGRRTRKQPQRTTKPARSGTAELTTRKSI
jgi:hypothetical protein